MKSTEFVNELRESIEIAERAVSQAQQKFMGMAHAMQKGKKIPGASKELRQVARTMKPSDVKDFAKTSHKGLPKKKPTEAVDKEAFAKLAPPRDKITYADKIAGAKKKKTMTEKWDTETQVSPSERGKYAGRTKEQLLKAYRMLKSSGPHPRTSPEFGRMKELAFAIRAKSDWGKVQ